MKRRQYSIAGIRFPLRWALVFSFALLFPGCTKADNVYHPAVNTWLESMRSKGLALSVDDRLAIERSPHSTHLNRDSLLQKYDTICAEIDSFRDSLATGFDGLSEADRLDRLTIAGDAIEAVLVEVLWPLWAGGWWSMNGTARKPHDGYIACGHYVQRMMEHAGFRVESRPGVLMAHLSSDEQVWSWGGVYRENLKNWNGLKQFADKEGSGLYIVGMSANWGHVLFMRVQDGQPAMFHHSGPSPGGPGVTYDHAEVYVRGFQRPHLIHAVKLDQHFARKWLAQSPFYPIKTKTYPGESATARRMSTIQTRLHDLGYYTLAIDYKYGPGTRSAIGSFQRRNGLPITLLPDDPTLRALDHALPASHERRDGYGRLMKAEDHVNTTVRELVTSKGLTYPPASIYVRGFKAERELELWAADGSDDKHVLLRTYPFTSYSGWLGPKRREGDGQIPEGCYHIETYNPASNFHLSLGLNYPNTIDRTRAGSSSPGGDIFIHGNEVTIGCIPIGDSNIEQLYVIAMDTRDKSGDPIPVHLFPYRFGETEPDAGQIPDDIGSLWDDLKEVFQQFESTHVPPTVNIRNGRYKLTSQE